jgi:hypothetical protein
MRKGGLGRVAFGAFLKSSHRTAKRRHLQPRGRVALFARKSLAAPLRTFRTLRDRERFLPTILGCGPELTPADASFAMGCHLRL